MSWKRQSVSMPITMAGIVGLSPSEKIGGIDIDPKSFIIAVFLISLIIKLSHIVLG